MRERTIRMALLVVDLFAAGSAIVGAVGLLAGFMHIPLTVLHGTPFADFTVPALLLGLVEGGQRLTSQASPVADGIMVGWMTVEFAMIGLGLWMQALYFAVGLLMIALAVPRQWAESPPQVHLPKTGVRG
jgi:hypothetical protein